MGSNSGLERRDLIKRAAAMGLIAVPTMSTLAACASGGGDDDNTGKSKGKTSAKNPLGVKKNSGLEVVIFDGGFGFAYINGPKGVFEKDGFGSVKTSKTTKIQSKLQARMNGGTPPDVINNSGAEAMNGATLFSHKQLADLTPVFDAPSADDPGTKVRDTLRPGALEFASYGTTKPYAMPVAYTCFGLWYSGKLMKDNGWEYPKTWDDLLKLGAKAKKKGIALWGYPGVFPAYINFSILQMISKHGGVEAMNAIDDLEDGAWQTDVVKDVFQAHRELFDRGFIYKRSPGIDHIKSQLAWNQYKTLFYPCGSWIENEQKDHTPKDFEMSVGPTPSLDGDKMPFETVWGTTGEPYIVPAKAKNVQGGMEFLRQMLGKKQAATFIKLLSSLSVVKGAEEGLTLGPGLSSAVKTLDAAASNTVNPRLRDFYPDLGGHKVIGAKFGEMMAGRASVKQTMDACQKEADKVKKDSSIPKIKHT
jgi:N-acetylglucosamine transport system substrate-binding protein